MAPCGSHNDTPHEVAAVAGRVAPCLRTRERQDPAVDGGQPVARQVHQLQAEVQASSQQLVLHSPHDLRESCRSRSSKLKASCAQRAPRQCAFLCALHLERGQQGDGLEAGQVLVDQREHLGVRRPAAAVLLLASWYSSRCLCWRWQGAHGRHCRCCARPRRARGVCPSPGAVRRQGGNHSVVRLALLRACCKARPPRISSLLSGPPSPPCAILHQPPPPCAHKLLPSDTQRRLKRSCDRPLRRPSKQPVFSGSSSLPQHLTVPSRLPPPSGNTLASTLRLALVQSPTNSLGLLGRSFTAAR